MKTSELCLSLMKADTADEAIAILELAGYWKDPVYWRYLDDNEGNFSSIGNQQSDPIAALIEKIVNGIDARLMNACLVAGIAPDGPSAPRSIREAVARFFEGKEQPHPDRDGKIAFWTDQRLTEEGRLLTLAATGHMPSDGWPCLTIADQGEGQRPDDFPLTFMSLSRRNKLRVPFVQGKFNMGGTGALMFTSGGHNLQLIVSRRNPALLTNDAQSRDREWAFTVVRRDFPPGGRSSVFRYLAPVEARPGVRGRVLSFPAPTWPILPEANNQRRGAYERHAPYGSLIKLFEYDWKSVRSNIVSSGGGLLRRIDQGLPELALPVRLFECRTGYRGHAGSFATNARGLIARLESERADNLEESFPIASLFSVAGTQLHIRVYAFKPKKADDYRLARYGVVFAVNGQTHASFSTEFFRRKSVGLSYLADSLLVVVDCTNIDGERREDLFMNSRDRLRDSDLAREIENRLEAFLHDEPILRELRNKRRETELEDKLRDSKPLSEVLKGLLAADSSLARLFLQGQAIPNPFPTGAGAVGGTKSRFVGRRFPTFFRFKGLPYGQDLSRDVYQNSRIRLTFETDAQDDYFTRDDARGAIQILVRDATGWRDMMDWWTSGPRAGIIHAWLNGPPVDLSVGDRVQVAVEVTDDSRTEAFSNLADLHIRPGQPPSGGSDGAGSKTGTTGSGSKGGRNSIALPNIKEVDRAHWDDYKFNEDTALTVRHAGDADESNGHSDLYDFFVNVDNRYLRSAEKGSSIEPKILRARFVYSLVLIGLALLRKDDSVIEDKDLNIEKRVAQTTGAVAPVLLPMIQSLSTLIIGDDQV